MPPPLYFFQVHLLGMNAGNPRRHQLLARVRVSTRADADLPVEDLSALRRRALELSSLQNQLASAAAQQQTFCFIFFEQQQQSQQQEAH